MTSLTIVAILYMCYCTHFTNGKDGSAIDDSTVAVLKQPFNCRAAGVRPFAHCHFT